MRGRGGRARPAGADEAMGRPWESSLHGQVRADHRGGCGLGQGTRLPGEEGKQGVAAVDKTTRRLRGDVTSVDEAAPNDRVVYRRGRGHGGEKERGRPPRTPPWDGRQGHRLCGKIRADGCGGCRRGLGCAGGGGRERRPPPQTRSQDGPGVASVHEASSAEGRRADHKASSAEGRGAEPAAVHREDGCGRVPADEITRGGMSWGCSRE